MGDTVFTEPSLAHGHLFIGDNVQHFNSILKAVKLVHNKKNKLQYFNTTASESWLVGLVLWHINHCRLFNAKSSLYIYIKYIGFDLVGFYGISTIVGYLMPNPLYTYILNI